MGGLVVTGVFFVRFRLAMRRSVRSRVAGLTALTLLASGLPALATVPEVAHATANANVHLSSAVTTSTSAPVLALTYAADKADVTPGDAVTYTSRLTNTGSEWQQNGTISAQATSASDAVVASWYDELDYRDSANRWQPIATYAAVRTGYSPKDPGAATGGLTVTATSKSSSGVTYPSSGDVVLGTVIGAAKTASWSFNGSVVLTPAQIATLTKSASAVRQTIHVEVTPRNSNAAQPASDTESLQNPLQAGTSATVTNATVSVTLPDATTLTVDKKTVAGLASIAPGITVSATSTYTLPVPGVEKTGESDGAYLARLHALVGCRFASTPRRKVRRAVRRLVAAAIPVTTTAAGMSTVTCTPGTTTPPSRPRPRPTPWPPASAPSPPPSTCRSSA